MTSFSHSQDSWKKLSGESAARLVTDDMVVGLGTGSTADYLVRALAQRLQDGLRIKGAICSSQATEDLARSLSIPITDLNMYPLLDIYIDGADEIDPQMHLIKGAGGALLREKILASVARRFIVIADETKKVSRLGLRYPVPVEVIPLAIAPIQQRLSDLGATVHLRQVNGRPFVTDNHNVILDCTFSEGIDDPTHLDTQIHAIVGVVESGLFLNLAQQAIIGGPNGIEIIP